MTDVAVLKGQQGCVLFLHCQTGVHAGAGSMLAHVDLPIQREVHTGHPVIFGSGVKGALREAFYGYDPNWVEAFFGSEPSKSEGGPPSAVSPERPGNTNQAGGKPPSPAVETAVELTSSKAGCAIFQEARVLLFPIRSFKGVFVWITCPEVWVRFQEDCGPHVGFIPSISIPEDADTALCDAEVQCDGHLVLEDFAFRIPTGDDAPDLSKWRKLVADMLMPGPAPRTSTDAYWQSAFEGRVAVLSDEVFYSLVRTRTQIETHVAIDESGTASSKGPWRVESLPPQTVLYCPVYVPRLLENGAKELLGSEGDAINHFREYLISKKFVFFGGDRTTGKGLVRLRISEGKL